LIGVFLFYRKNFGEWLSVPFERNMGLNIGEGSQTLFNGFRSRKIIILLKMITT